MMHAATVKSGVSAKTAAPSLAATVAAAAGRWLAGALARREQQARSHVRARLARQSNHTLQELGFGRIEIEAIRREAAKASGV